MSPEFLLTTDYCVVSKIPLYISVAKALQCGCKLGTRAPWKTQKGPRSRDGKCWETMRESDPVLTVTRFRGNMEKRIPVFLNCGRNATLAMHPAVRKAEAMREVKVFIVPRILGHGILGTDIPDSLVSEEMAERYLEITPPVFSLMPDYQSIINEIERSYVIGNDFSALSASCVVIERLLNQARIALHKHQKVIKKLWDKGPTNAWDPNIDALKEWGYLDGPFASELYDMYREVRCRYLHCGEIQSLRNDARRAVTAAYKLMTIFIGFPEALFSWVAGGPTCKNEADPRFLEFYKPYWPNKQ